MGPKKMEVWWGVLNRCCEGVKHLIDHSCLAEHFKFVTLTSLMPARVAVNCSWRPFPRDPFSVPEHASRDFTTEKCPSNYFLPRPHHSLPASPLNDAF